LGEVVDIERRKVELLAQAMAPVLREQGALIVDTARLESVDRWRKAARRAGRLRLVPVRPGLVAVGPGGGAPPNDREVTEHDRREAARRVEEMLFGSQSEQPESAGPVRLVPVD
jgi:hypothetical protein